MSGGVKTTDERSFACPHCRALAQQDWTRLYEGQDDDVVDPTDLRMTRCFACRNVTIWREIPQTGWASDPWATGAAPFERIWPSDRSDGAPDPPPDLPSSIRSLFDEAASVLEASPRAAAALLRLALEALLDEHYPNAANLNDAIRKASADGLPETVVQAMDVLRFNGNAAIHELQRGDTPDTVAGLFKILALVVERLITQPRQIRELHEAMPPGVLGQIKRRSEPDRRGAPDPSSS